MNNWVETTLSQVSEVKLCNVDKKTNKDEIEVRLCNYMDVYKNPFINANKAKTFMIATCNKSELDNFKIKEGQVAITKDSEKRDDIGISTYMAESFDDVVLGYHTALITPEKGSLSGKFLNYWFNTKFAKVYFENNAGGSGQRCTLPIDIIKSIPLKLPPIYLQEKIASIFYNIDSKIELNNRINSELEAMAKTIYDYWFVQFDSPDKNGKPYKSSGGKMVWSEELKREVPDNWEKLILGDVVESTGTGLNPRDNFTLGTGNNYYVTIKNIEQGRVILDNKCDRINDEALEIINKRSDLRVGDILFTSIEPVGITYLILEKPKNWNINESVFTIRPNYDKVTSEFLYMFLSGDYIKSYTKNVAAGSIHKGVRHSVLKDCKFILPAKEIINQFTEIINPILNKIDLIEKENQQLTSLRDWLLPMLMNGQVKVN